MCPHWGGQQCQSSSNCNQLLGRDIPSHLAKHGPQMSTVFSTTGKPAEAGQLDTSFITAVTLTDLKTFFRAVVSNRSYFWIKTQRWKTKNSRICGRIWRLWTNWHELMPFPGRCPFATTQNLGSHMLKPPRRFRNSLYPFPRVQL